LTGVPLTTPHGLQIAAEALFDAGSHILPESFRIPRARAVLSEETARRLEERDPSRESDGT